MSTFYYKQTQQNSFDKMSVLIRIGNATESAMAHLWGEIVFLLMYTYLPSTPTDPISVRLVHAIIVTAILTFVKDLCYTAPQILSSNKQRDQ